MPSPGSKTPPHPRRAGAAPPCKRAKKCETCREPGDALYRARGDARAPWRFYCGPCLLRLKTGNAGYSYGGTWKRKKEGRSALKAVFQRTLAP